MKKEGTKTDDDHQMQKLVTINVEDAGYHFVSVATGKHGLRFLGHQEVDLILVDMFMPEMDGLVLIPLLRKTRPTSKIIAITAGLGDKHFLDVAKILGANDTLEKPFGRQKLPDAVALQLSLGRKAQEVPDRQ
ncbi:MAG: response regulator [Nitrospirota bacterium]